MNEFCLLFPTSGWRVTAARVVEELFPLTAQSSWDDLLDLRGQLVRGGDLAELLESFSRCRRGIEADHYLPFYRLRKILVGHLTLEGSEAGMRGARIALHFQLEQPIGQWLRGGSET